MNNVGILLSGRPEEIPLEVWERVIEVNLLSVVRSVHAFTPGMIARGRGHMINTASFAGLYPYAWDRLPYVASKAAIFSLSEGLALYLKPQGIGVSCLCPGPVKTQIARHQRHYSQGVRTRGPGPQFALLEAEAVGEMVVEAILADRFFIPTDEAVRSILVEHASDPDAFLDKQIAGFDEPA